MKCKFCSATIPDDLEAEIVWTENYEYEFDGVAGVEAVCPSCHHILYRCVIDVGGYVNDLDRFTRKRPPNSRRLWRDVSCRFGPPGIYLINVDGIVLKARIPRATIEYAVESGISYADSTLEIVPEPELRQKLAENFVQDCLKHFRDFGFQFEARLDAVIRRHPDVAEFIKAKLQPLLSVEHFHVDRDEWLPGSQYEKHLSRVTFVTREEAEAFVEAEVVKFGGQRKTHPNYPGWIYSSYSDKFRRYYVRRCTLNDCAPQECIDKIVAAARRQEV